MKSTKIINFGATVLLVAGFTGCDKTPQDQPDPREKGKEITITVSTAGRTWQSGDEFFLYDGKSSQKVVTSSAGETASLKAKVDEEAASFLVYYPYSETVKASSATVVSDVLSAAQTAVAGGYPAEGLKYAVSTKEGAAIMSGLFGYLKFQVAEEGYTTFTITGKDNEVLAGGFSADCVSAIPSVWASGAEKTVTLTADGGFQPNVWYYVAVIPQALKSGASCTLSGSGKDDRTLAVEEKLSAGIGQEAELGVFRAPAPKVEYYTVPLENFVWSTSNVYFVKNASKDTVAMVAREYFGATVKAQGVVFYAWKDGKADYSKGVIAQITKLNNTDPGEENLQIHGGTLSITDMNPDNVVYTPGTSLLPKTVYIKKDGSSIEISEPDGCVPLETVAEAYVLTSDVREHPVTKVGTQIWLGLEFQTTKYADGTQIPQYSNGSPMWADNASAMVIYNNGTADYYMYNGYSLGYSDAAADGENCPFANKIAPKGWRLPTASEYVDGLCGFCGNTLDILKNLSLFRAGNTYKVTPSSGNAKVGSLGYASTWTSTPGATSKAYLAGLKSSGDPATVNAPQSLKNAFSVRLIEE
ncbi:MAG: fibrobacter succinogenes major paralogous domain-containing protein [Bacteroidales bacterium]|nr:fibrobacter succinogenes major paralogous domain-containing protein [Bacteroidales bacterium]